MASSLSVPQTLAVFEALQVPWNAGTLDGSVGFYTMDGMGALAQVTTISNSTLGQAQTLVNTFLSNLGTNNVPLETVLKGYCDRWIALGTQVVDMDHSLAGDVSNVSWSPAKERMLIATRIQGIVPFFRAHEVLAKQEAAVNGAESNNLPVTR